MTMPLEISRELHAKALRESLWLALFHAQLLGDSDLQNQLTTILALVDAQRAAPSDIPV